jgi:26S proteasome regulatory subunit N2
MSGVVGLGVGGGVGVGTAAAFVSLLEEPSNDLVLFSLKALDSIVHHFWADIADALPKITSLTQNEQSEHRQYANLLASKVHYHLNNMDLSLQYALGAGSLVDITANDEFVQTLIKYSIDTYIRLRQEQVEAEAKKRPSPTIDERLECIVMSMFDRCFRDGEYQQALGIAIESRRLDKVCESISKSGNISEMLEYAFKTCLRVVKNFDFRRLVLLELVQIHNAQKEKNYFEIFQLLILLDDALAISEILRQLITNGDLLTAYQLGFDLCDSCTQNFLSRVRSHLHNLANPLRLLNILEGKITVEMHLNFLCWNNKTDIGVLKNIRDSVEPRNMVCHNATIFANALMHAGTTKDGFLRENLEWLQKATNWARFSATAGLGVIHKGHLKMGMNLLRPYLPQTPSLSPYSEGGSLYALGIIHANYGQEVTTFLLDELNKARLSAHTTPQASEVIQHGASLGLGLAAMATGNIEIYQTLLEIVKLENAIAGEAAGLAMGLIMLGTASEEAILAMVERAQLSQHEKIIRGLSIGLALVMYGREEQADALIEQLTSDKDAILRYGAMFTLGLAYCGTANNSAISRLLHVAVSDVSDDVRRAAVMNLGFLLCSQPEQCPKIVSLLAESFNPHVRYGATLAVGISCAGSGLKEAIALLEPMSKDPVDFVRQGAMIALSMIVIQTSQGENPKVEKIRQLFENCVSDKHDDIMAKFGAIIAAAIVNGGGRNVTISPFTSSGYHKNMCAIVGLAVFCQYWYWYPMMHFISLALSPIAVIGLTKDLEMPVWSFKSNAPPSRFAYPPEFKPPQKEAPKKVTTAVLSTSKKAKARAQQRAEERAAKGLVSSTMSDVSGLEASVDAEMKDVEKKEEKEDEKEKGKEEKVKEKEATFELKENPARVTNTQRSYITCEVNSRWQPIKKSLFGIVLLADRQPNEAVILVDKEQKIEAIVEKTESLPSASLPEVASTTVSTPSTGATTEAPPPDDFEFEE